MYINTPLTCTYANPGSTPSPPSLSEMVVILASADHLAPGTSSLSRSPSNYRFISIPGYVTPTAAHPELGCKVNFTTNQVPIKSNRYDTALMTVCMVDIDRPTALLFPFLVDKDASFNQARVVHVKQQLLQAVKTILYTHSKEFDLFTSSSEECKQRLSRAAARVRTEIDEVEAREENAETPEEKEEQRVYQELLQRSYDARRLQQESSCTLDPRQKQQAAEAVDHIFKDNSYWLNQSGMSIVSEESHWDKYDTDFKHVGDFYVSMTDNPLMVEHMMNWGVFGAKPEDFSSRLQQHLSDSSYYPADADGCKYIYVVAQCVTIPKRYAGKEGQKYRSGFGITLPRRIANVYGRLSVSALYPTVEYDMRVSHQDQMQERMQAYDCECIGIGPGQVRPDKSAQLLKVPFQLPPFAADQMEMCQYNKNNRYLYIRPSKRNNVSEVNRAIADALMKGVHDSDEKQELERNDRYIHAVATPSFLGLMSVPALSTRADDPICFFNACGASTLFGNHLIIGTKLNGAIAPKQSVQLPLRLESWHAVLHDDLEKVRPLNPRHQQFSQFSFLSESAPGARAGETLPENQDKAASSDIDSMDELAAMFDKIVEGLRKESPHAKVNVIGSQFNCPPQLLPQETRDLFEKTQASNDRAENAFDETSD